MEENGLWSIGLIITVVSFLGFCVENLWLAMTKGYMDNRNMYLPFLIGYGIAIATIYFLFGTPARICVFTIPLEIQSRLARISVYFGIVCLCVSLGEIILGTLMEKICGIVWWNYSTLPLHITKYTSVPTTVAFGSMITLFMDRFFAPLYRRFLEIPASRLRGISCFFLILMIGDYIFSMVKMYHSGSLQKHWHIDTTTTKAHKLWQSRHPSA